MVKKGTQENQDIKHFSKTVKSIIVQKGLDWVLDMLSTATIKRILICEDLKKGKTYRQITQHRGFPSSTVEYHARFCEC